VTGDILKEIIAIFYEPLVKVYKAANIADFLMDTRNFADELIKVIEQADMNDNEELRVGLDLDAFVKENISSEDWEQVQQEAEELHLYFTEVKSRKRDKVKHMAGLDHVNQSSSATAASGSRAGTLSSEDGEASGEPRERERMAKELRKMGLQDEDVDELEMISWDSKDGSKEGDDSADGEMGLSVPKVPMIDRLQEPLVRLMDKAVFQSARA
ncbi:hypothetical protein BGZ65_009188, partial [Modicella reniformis]